MAAAADNVTAEITWDDRLQLRIKTARNDLKEEDEEDVKNELQKEIKLLCEQRDELFATMKKK
jgi:hypothetical protein